MKRYYLLLLLILIAVGGNAQTCYLFIGSYNFNRNKEGVYVYRFDTLSGALTMISATRGIPNPSYVTLSPNGKYLYACTETLTNDEGSVSSFEFDCHKGVLTFINSQKSGGANPVYATVDKTGKWLVNANYTQGGVSFYPLSVSGTIQTAQQLRTYIEGSVSMQHQERAHVHCVAFSPAQDHVFFPDLGADKIRCYSFDAAKSSPLAATTDSFITTDLGSGPRHLTFHPNGRYAYCTEEMAGFISVYAYNNGMLIPIQRIATHDKERKTEFSIADIHISSDGRFLYASNRTHQNNIAIFSIYEGSGRLTLVGYEPVHGNHPRNFTLDPTGNFLLVANQVSGNVVVFKRDKKTGLLTRTKNHLKILNPSCLQMRIYEN
ncbi:MAG: 6-phosphogluconolactonase [Flavipsychrobacter sp.]|nr:6-phosphogluconolactonase [Flavipsychrobacter sp.]